MKVLFGNVLLRPIVQEKTESGMYLPEEKQNEPVKPGTVIAIGSGSLALSGDPIPVEVQVGDTVLYKTHGTYKVKHEGTDCLIIEQRDILMVT